MNADLERLIEIYTVTQLCRSQDYADAWDAWRKARDEEAAKRRLIPDRLETYVEREFLVRSEKNAKRASGHK